MEILIERLKELMADKTLKEMAEKLDISPSTLSMYFSGKRIPHPEIIIKVCRYFDVSSDYLLGLSDVKERDKYLNENDYVIEIKKLKKEISRLNEIIGSIKKEISKY